MKEMIREKFLDLRNIRKTTTRIIMKNQRRMNLMVKNI